MNYEADGNAQLQKPLYSHHIPVCKQNKKKAVLNTQIYKQKIDWQHHGVSLKYHSLTLQEWKELDYIYVLQQGELAQVF